MTALRVLRFRRANWISAFRHNLQEVIYRAIERDPQNRYASAREFAKDLTHLDQVGVTDRPSFAIGESSKPRPSESLFFKRLALKSKITPSDSQSRALSRKSRSGSEPGPRKEQAFGWARFAAFSNREAPVCPSHPPGQDGSGPSQTLSRWHSGSAGSRSIAR